MSIIVDLFRKDRSSKRTLIEDEALYPYFISAGSGSDYVVHKLKEDKEGKTKYVDVCFPGTFLNCLEYISREKLHENEHYTSVREYVEAWKKVYSNIKHVYKEWNVNNI